MAVITPEIKEFIKNNLGWITTVSKDGELDLARRCPCSCWTTRTSPTTSAPPASTTRTSRTVPRWSSLSPTSRRSRATASAGNVVLHVDDDIYNEQVKVAEEKGTKKPAVIPVLEVTEIQDLASGPTAGKTIAKD